MAHNWLLFLIYCQDTTLSTHRRKRWHSFSLLVVRKAQGKSAFACAYPRSYLRLSFKLVVSITSTDGLPFARPTNWQWYPMWYRTFLFRLHSHRNIYHLARNTNKGKNLQCCSENQQWPVAGRLLAISLIPRAFRDKVPTELVHSVQIPPYLRVWAELHEVEAKSNEQV